MNISLQGKIALVTGASRGIGRAIALALGQAGAAVMGTATTETGVEAINDCLQKAHLQGRGIVLDVTNPDQIESVISAIRTDWGAPDILVNNAGITQDGLLLRMKDKEWLDVINTDLTSIYRLSKACLPHMMKGRKGRIISIASVVAVAGNAGQTNYAAAKAGILGFTRALSREVASRGVTVNVVAPGFIETDMTRGLEAVQTQKVLQQIPLQRLGQPEEVAAAVTFLASPQAEYITGHTLHVNGGMYMS